MRKLFSKKLLSVLLASSMVIGSASALTGCGSKKERSYQIERLQSVGKLLRKADRLVCRHP